MANIIEMKNICKYFDGVRANYNVNFEVREGEVHALLGENGAGKTTLMNILYGLYTQTSGDIYLRGKKVQVNSPRQAIELGIGMVHQHFMLVPALSVIENVILGLESGKGPLLDLNSAAQKLAALAKEYNMEIDPGAKVWQLSVGQQQRLEILKAIYRGAKILILDEPTAVLTPQEVEELFFMVRKLTKQGNTVIFISHKLNEVVTICDRLTVLRSGEVVATIATSETDPVQLAKMMVGREIAREYPRADTEQTETILELKGVHCQNSRKLPALKNVNLTVKHGEILGICGVDGNGQTELAEVITGLTKVTEGNVFIRNKDVTNQPAREILKKGVSHIPADRHKSGVVLGMNLTENVLMMNYFLDGFHKGSFLNWKYIRQYVKNILEQYQVKTPSANELMSNLSGGNQQKVVLGRELERRPELLIAMHPTRGLDIGATEYIQHAIIKERDRGTAVLLISTELEEILSISDRVAVIYEGEIMGVVSPQTPIHQLGLMMAGTRLEGLDEKVQGAE